MTRATNKAGRHCQKCGRPQELHNLFRCVRCKSNCCSSCVEALSHVGQPDRCHECAVVVRWEEVQKWLREGAA